MPENDQVPLTAAGATVVISLEVRPERRRDYEAWQSRINAAAAEFPGFEAVEVLPPSPGLQGDWVVVYRFRTAEELSSWLDSEVRRDLVAEAAPLLETAHESVIATPAAAGETVTVVASHRVKSGQGPRFEQWLAGITAAAREFPGFLGSELLRPVAGVQEEWVVVFRFAGAASLERWLDSETRRGWLAKAEPIVERLGVHRVGAGLGGWFPSPVGSGEAPMPPPDWKQAMAVLLALYPAVMLLTLWLSPRLEFLPLAANIFIGNVVSVAALQWLLMPATTRMLGPWLEPRRKSATWWGTVALVGVYAVMVAGFVAVE